MSHAAHSDATAAVVPVPVSPAPLERFRAVVGDDYARMERAIDRARELLAGRAIWHVNSTARGGGVAEMLQSLLAYARGAGVDVRWLTITGDPEFFAVTKRIHNRLHGAPGDGGELGAAERESYERTLTRSADELRALVHPDDVVYLHDPQTAGLTPALRESVSAVVWRCHVGIDHPNELARGAWEFLRPYVEQADAYVFSRRVYAWEGLAAERLWIVPPSIDAFSPKNQDMAADVAAAILGRIGIAEPAGSALPAFIRQDGTQGRVDRPAEVDQEAPVPEGAPLVVQVSRWDRLKDFAGLLTAFTEHLRHERAHLLCAGPAVAGVADDPEGAVVLDEIRAQRAGLSGALRARVHLACLPMDDADENAAMVNAIQRSADIVVQKSLAEGFGLTVAEAMWKARPVVASGVGGIQDQIVDGESGILVEPRDLTATAAAIDGLLDHPERARAIGDAARERVRGSFLGTRHLVQYMDLLDGLLTDRRS